MNSRAYRSYITGHTGFKGSWLTLWLRELGANVTGFALVPPTVPNNYEASAVADALRADYRADLRDRAALDRAIRASRPDVIFHLAAQSVVLEGFAEPAETFSVNVLGTAVLLDALRATGQPCAVVVVTSDKCYANDESGRSFEEDDPLGGHDPYSASKAGTELVAQAYRNSFFTPVRCRRPRRRDRDGSSRERHRRGRLDRAWCRGRYRPIDRRRSSRPTSKSERDPTVAARPRAIEWVPDPRSTPPRSRSGGILSGLELRSGLDRRGDRSAADGAGAGRLGRWLLGGMAASPTTPRKPQSSGFRRAARARSWAGIHAGDSRRRCITPCAGIGDLRTSHPRPTRRAWTISTRYAAGRREEWRGGRPDDPEPRGFLRTAYAARAPVALPSVRRIQAIARLRCLDPGRNCATPCRSARKTINPAGMPASQSRRAETLVSEEP